MRRSEQAFDEGVYDFIIVGAGSAGCRLPTGFLPIQSIAFSCLRLAETTDTTGYTCQSAISFAWGIPEPTG